jgi:3-oxoacyl-[acyl-carrier-protein] synthase II
MKSDDQRIVITGIGLTAPNGNDLASYRGNLVEGRPRIGTLDLRYMGTAPAGICDFDPLRYQKKREIRVGTQAGNIAIYCAHEALADAAVELAERDTSRVGVYIGTTEHGNVETENEVYNLSQFDYDTRFWSHHHNPRTVANNPAGEITLNLDIHGPHYTIGAACAAGNAGMIQGAQMLQLGEVDLALAGGVSESIRSFGIFAGFRSQGALAEHEDPNRASRPFDRDRNGIVVSEGGAIYALERLSDARRRGARIHGELRGWALNSDASDYVLPNAERQAECMQAALRMAGMTPADITIVSTHATATQQGDKQECRAVREVFGGSPRTYVNNTKSYIGHAMGAAGSLELAGNLPAFADGIVHPTINIEHLDPDCELPNLVINESQGEVEVSAILNSSFGMLGINSALIVTRPE